MSLSTDHPYRSEVLHGVVAGERALIWSQPPLAPLSQQYHRYCRIPEGWSLVEADLCYVGLIDEEGHIWPFDWRGVPDITQVTVEVEVGGAPYPWTDPISPLTHP